MFDDDNKIFKYVGYFVFFIVNSLLFYTLFEYKVEFKELKHLINSYISLPDFMFTFFIIIGGIFLEFLLAFVIIISLGILSGLRYFSCYLTQNLCQACTQRLEEEKRMENIYNTETETKS